MGNFTFLEIYWSNLAKLGNLAEKYVYSDPNTSGEEFGGKHAQQQSKMGIGTDRCKWEACPIYRDIDQENQGGTKW